MRPGAAADLRKATNHAKRNPERQTDAAGGGAITAARAHNNTVITFNVTTRILFQLTSNNAWQPRTICQYLSSVSATKRSGLLPFSTPTPLHTISIPRVALLTFLCSKIHEFYPFDWLLSQRQNRQSMKATEI